MEITVRSTQYMHTSTGKPFFPFEPRLADWNVEFVAHHLACQGRWNGATQHPYVPQLIFLSVAEHSVHVSRYVEEILGRPDLALEALLHDAPEAPLGDIIRPIKYSPGVREAYKRIEDLNEHSMATAFNLVQPFPPEIKIADEAVCCAESRFCVPKAPGFDWSKDTMVDETNCSPFHINMFPPHQAKEFFLARYRQVIANRAQYRALPSI